MVEHKKNHLVSDASGLLKVLGHKGVAKCVVKGKSELGVLDSTDERRKAYHG